MKVLHIIDSGGLYGAEIMLLNLVAEQIRLGFKPAIASIGEPGISEKPIEREAQRQGFSIKAFRMIPGPNAIGAFRVLRFAEQFGANLLHSHGYKGNILFGLMPRRMRGIPLISTLHGWTNTGGFNKMAVYEALDRLALRFVDAVVCVNAAMLENPVLKKSQFRCLHIVNNGLPSKGGSVLSRREILKILPMDEQVFMGKDLIIGTIGRLSEEKGYDDLIRALRLVLDSGIEARLIMIGEGHQRQMLADLARKMGLQDQVIMIGYQQDASKYMALFDVFVISSLTEGLPITLLEAMQARVPVVATRVGGIPDVLDAGRAGKLVEPANPRSLADGIISLSKDSSLKTEITQKGYDRFVSNYSSRKMANGYLNVYRRVLDIQ